MIIDIHTHFWGKNYIPRAFHMITAKAWAAEKPGRDPEKILPKIDEGLIDLDGKLFIENMDQAGVDVAFIMAADFGVHWSGEEPFTPLEEQFQNYSELQKRYPGRIYAFAFLDPRRKGAVELFVKAIRELNLIGCGEFSCKDISVANDVCQPMIRKCADLGVPVLIHTRAGTGTSRTSLLTEENIAHPVHVETILKKYPGLKVIISHVGYPVWWERAAHIAGQYQNCYLDISNWHREIEDANRLIPKLACMRDLAGIEHLCFGSDQSSGKRHCKENSVMSQWSAFLKELPEKAEECGYKFTRDEVDMIMGGSAKKLFNL